MNTFDYDAKYNGKSKEITPADLDDQVTNNIKELTKEIWCFKYEGYC